MAHAALLIQLLPPGAGGVADFAHGLRAQWQSRGVASELITLTKEPAWPHALVRRVEEELLLRSADDGARRGACSVVLHYSGYGYESRGLCFWLLDELRALRDRHGSDLRLVVVFHELFALGGPPWRSAFWLAPWQASIAHRLSRMADALWTNSEHHRRWLSRVVKDSVPLTTRPVFSGVGEPTCPLAAWSERLPQAIVFGAPSTRRRVFDALRGQQSVLQRLGIEQLVEAGNGESMRSDADGLPARHLGRLAPEAVGRLLAQSRFGLIDYPAALLGKSSVFAAYAAHGCTVIDTRPHNHDVDGLVAGIHYLPLPTPRAARHGVDELAALGAALAGWYARHTVANQAEQMLSVALPAPLICSGSRGMPPA